MVPPLTDDIWEEFVENLHDYSFKNFSTRMLHSRLKSVLHSGELDKEEVKAIAHEFFTSNYESIGDDIEHLLLKKEKR